jgi:CheY-like chemotaxis protein
MLADDPLKILIVEQSNDEANRIISILRSADYQVEAQLAADQQQLQQYLSKSNWDLLIAPTGTDILPAQQIFQCKRRAERDFPVILISDTYDPGILIEDLQKGGEGKVRFQTLMAGMTDTGVDVIVPFVEKASVLPILWQQGVQYIQGHYVQPPSFTMDYDFSENS